ncbi:bifunctional 3,4-dihydroxy-2-butanone-4-phosphate synthase/GTP cyclohydrolase II [Rhodococcus sp. NPDC059968]|uniref:bifunctional 3,4-dihydroxy-2-butanone-4-phosphate synthase/GTP cyclohydrolase II n=1 Tax=Rhodococcus sp. NPDC059968 TaxID=3347017 RepID=UPI00366C5448
MTKLQLDTIDRAINDIAAGRPVVVLDADDRENEGDLVFAACHATPELMALTVRNSSGIVCAPADGSVLDRLALPLMTADNHDRMGTAFTVSVDARDGVSTGISAHDRALTVRTLADPDSEADQLVRPGHIFPLRARDGGVLVRPGHTEAAVDLVRLAGLPPVGVISELVDDDGTVKGGPRCREFADAHGLALISIADLVAYRKRHEPTVQRQATARIPTKYGVLTAHGYRDVVTGVEHLALVHGDLGNGHSVLTRIHSECLTGDVLGSGRCDCGDQLDTTLHMIGEEGRGVLVYLRGHEGRGIGLVDKLRAYALQDGGLDTVDANLRLGLPVDARDYTAGAHILDDLGIMSTRLLTNNPDKASCLTGCGIETQRVPLHTTATIHNLPYLDAKRRRLGHDLPLFRNPA